MKRTTAHPRHAAGNRKTVLIRKMKLVHIAAPCRMWSHGTAKESGGQIGG